MSEGYLDPVARPISRLTGHGGGVLKLFFGHEKSANPGFDVVKVSSQGHVLFSSRIGGQSPTKSHLSSNPAERSAIANLGHPCRCLPAGPSKRSTLRLNGAFVRGRPPLYTAHYVCGALKRAPAHDFHRGLRLLLSTTSSGAVKSLGRPVKTYAFKMISDININLHPRRNAETYQHRLQRTLTTLTIMARDIARV